MKHRRHLRVWSYQSMGPGGRTRDFRSQFNLESDPRVRVDYGLSSAG